MSHTVALSVVLATIWLVNSGHYSPLLLSLGAGSVAFVVYLSRQMDLIDGESQPLHIASGFGSYLFWLLGQLVRSNIDVLVRIWRGASAINPVVATLPIRQSSDLGRVIVANSITLTPGTIAVAVQRDSVTVHALSQEGIEALATGDMDRRVSELER